MSGVNGWWSWSSLYSWQWRDNVLYVPLVITLWGPYTSTHLYLERNTFDWESLVGPYYYSMCHFCILPVRYILGYPNPSGQMAWSLRPDKQNVWISQALPFTTIPFLKARIFLRHLISLILLFLILYFFANCCQRRFTEQFRDCKLEFYCQNSMLKSPFQLQTSNSTCQARAHTHAPNETWPHCRHRSLSQ